MAEAPDLAAEEPVEPVDVGALYTLPLGTPAAVVVAPVLDAVAEELVEEEVLRVVG